MRIKYLTCDGETVVAEIQAHMEGRIGSDKVKAIEFNIKGIKCDNPDCDFRDETVKFEDYPLWLNRPCPKCGWNLLTQADLDETKALIKLVNIINWITKP